MMANSETLNVVIGPRRLEGLLHIPSQPSGLIIFAHGSGSSRFSPRNSFVAGELSSHGFATLLFDVTGANSRASDVGFMRMLGG